MDEASKIRSTGFPTIPLDEAVETLREVAKYGTRQARSAFAQYLGHSTAYSGPFKSKLAAFKDWGLVETSRETVSLTDLGRRLALPPDPEKVGADLLEAFRAARPFATIYEACAKGQPLERSTIANMAVHQVGIAPASKERFAQSFVKSAVAVGLAEENGAGKVLLRAEPAQSERDPRSHSDESSELGRKEATLPKVVPPNPQETRGAGIRLPWSVQGGEVVLDIRLRHPLPPSAFGELSKVTAAIEDLVSVLGVASPDSVEGSNSASE